MQQQFPAQSIDAVFNAERFYGNIQGSDAIEVCHFDLDDASRWKSMDPDLVRSTLQSIQHQWNGTVSLSSFNNNTNHLQGSQDGLSSSGIIDTLLKQRKELIEYQLLPVVSLETMLESRLTQELSGLCCPPQRRDGFGKVQAETTTCESNWKKETRSIFKQVLWSYEQERLTLGRCHQIGQDFFQAALKHQLPWDHTLRVS